MTRLEKFHSSYRVDATGCWIWQGSINTSGYGRFYLNGKKMSASQAAWLLFRGPIPVGMCVLHHCDVRRCANPDHLFLGTVQDNSDDKIAKGRMWWALGEAHWNAVLTEQEVLDIRASTQSSRKLAKAYGVHRSTILGVQKRRNWAWL